MNPLLKFDSLFCCHTHASLGETRTLVIVFILSVLKGVRLKSQFLCRRNIDLFLCVGV